MEDEEQERQAHEVLFLSFTTPIPDYALLEITTQERMNNVPLPKLPFIDKPLVKKSEKISVVCCAGGEKALSDNDNIGALKAFTTALCLAPAFSKMIAHCYFWRSVTLQKLKAFPESLQDTERALKLEITEKQKENLLNRRKIIEGLILNKSIGKVQINPDESSQEELTLSYGENSEIPGVSSAMALVYNKKFGRHFVATRDIKIGDVLMIQKPYVFVPKNEGCKDTQGKKWICDFCLNSTLVPIPCESCTTFLYCSFKCRSEAYEKYHKTECKIMNVEPLIGPQSTMFLRTLIIATNHGEKFKETFNLMKRIQVHKDRRTAGFKDGKLDGSSINALLNLLSHNDKVPRSGLVMYAAKLTAALKKYTNFFKGSNDLSSAGQLLMFLSYTCFMNLYTIRRNNYKNGIALGMYPIFNLLNHSCESNVLAYDNKQRNKILRACRDIKKGEQIFITYSSFETLHMSTQKRRKLMENKYFTCRCEACERNYTYKPELIGTLKVPVQLKKILKKKPNDTESLWELLKVVFNQYKHPNLEAKMIQIALVNAYLGGTNEDQREVLKLLRIL